MGRNKRLRKKIKNRWNGYIDFSDIEVNGYFCVKSTYKKGSASALITQKNIDIINRLIPLFKEKEKFLSRFFRLMFDKKAKSTDLESSFLFRLYCNGFTNAFKDIDKKIKESTNKLIFPAIEDCQLAISNHIRKLEDRNNLPTEDTKGASLFWDYLLDLGEQEGATVRGILYEQEISLGITYKPEKKKPGRKKSDKSLSEMFSTHVPDNNLLMGKVEQYLISKRSELDIAYLKIALEELQYIHRGDVKPFRDALDIQFKEKIPIVGERGVQKSYSRLISLMSGTKKLVKDIGEDKESIDTLKEFLLN